MKRSKFLAKSLFSAVVCLNLLACTDPGEVTGVSAATGGVIGAGLGAIIGNQTGDAGAGVAIGAAAGAGTGALIGNALEAQQQAIQTQDEAIERQEQQIRAQNSQIEELRRTTDDSVQFGPRGTGDRLREALNRQPPTAYGSSPGTLHESTIVPGSRSPVIHESNAPMAAAEASNAENIRRELESERTIINQEPTEAAAMIPPPVQDQSASNECREAADEVQKASGKNEIADRLFHYRRALRLCPDEPSYHNGIGEIYLSLNRSEDARFEFQEALRLKPGYSEAQRNLESLGSRDVY